MSHNPILTPEARESRCDAGSFRLPLAAGADLAAVVLSRGLWRLEITTWIDAGGNIESPATGASGIPPGTVLATWIALTVNGDRRWMIASTVEPAVKVRYLYVRGDGWKVALSNTGALIALRCNLNAEIAANILEVC